MNKYQEYILKNCLSEKFAFSLCCLPCEEDKDKRNFYGVFDKETDTFTLTQDEDIERLEYILVMPKPGSPFERVYTGKGDTWQEVEPTFFLGDTRAPCFRIPLDFRDKIERLRFTFKGGFADDYVLNLKYVEADKEAYYAKKAEEERLRLEQEAKRAHEALLEAAAVSTATGSDLVNVYFRPCCEEYERTEVFLYRGEMLLACYKVEKDVFFLSIGGLAFGEYEVVVKQFGKDNKLLLETERLRFSLSRPAVPYTRTSL